MSLLLSPPPVLDATRRDFLALLGAAGLLAGCATGGPAPAPAAPGFPRTVRHAGGETVLAAPPSRIFATRAYTELDTLLALGITPALRGEITGRGLSSWQAAAREVPTSAVPGADLEALAAAGVDLILVADIDLVVAAEEFAAYAEFAPVIALPTAQPSDIGEQLRILGQALGIEAAAERRAAEVDALLDGFTAPRTPSSISTVTSYETGIVLTNTSESVLSRLLERVGLPGLSSPPPPAGQARRDYVQFSAELVGQLDADLLLGLAFDDTAALLDGVEASPLFQALPAVRDGRYRRLGSDAANALAVPTALNLPIALDALTSALRP